MKNFLLIITLVLSLQNNAQTPSQDQNYILNVSYQKGYIKGQEQNALINEKIVGVNYFDGLGRPMQNVAVRAGGANQDIITHIDYDSFGRQDKDYLPYAATSNGGAIRENALGSTNSFYFTSKYEGTTNPYSEKLFEASPLNRLLQQAAPGVSWELGTGHEIKFSYQTNVASEVKLYTATAIWNATLGLYNTSLVNSAGILFYEPSQLYKTITYDENHTTGSNHSTEEFKDKQGRVVLKRAYAYVASVSTAHDTYYVYDDYGNLTYVLPPKMDASTATLATVNSQLSELGYQYKYDSKNRLVEKKIPGKGWEYIVYDKLDRPILTQDAKQRLINQWSFTKYDAFNRVAYTGILIDGDGFPRAYMENEFSGTTLSETKLTANQNILNTTIYYSNNSTPNLNYGDVGTEIQTINYYDNYTFDKDILTIPDTSEGQAIVNYNDLSQGLTKGLATGSKVRVLGTTSWITTINGYDTKARPIYTASRNNYLSTTDVITSLLDFVDKVDKTTATHTKTGNSNITTVDLFIYDHAGRLTKQTQAINGATTPEVIAENTYDELGQLTIKGVGGKTSRLQTVNYAYNIRGWLKQINDPNILGTDLFGFKINYNTASHGATPLYNGNIAETEWKTQNDNVLRWYNYGYDALNRITKGISSDGKFDLGSTTNPVTYDPNGNILILYRKGAIVANPVIGTSANYGVMDQLTYTYQANSNKLTIVSDVGNDTFGFKDDQIGTGTDTTIDYTYDPNGNLLSDTNKGVTAITYNHLNLPTQVTFSGTNRKIDYFYDAVGAKLKKVVTDASSLITTDYAGNYVYENTGSGDVLKFFNQPEGYIEPDGETYKYVYQFKDHLGNIRLSYADSDLNGAIDPNTEILSESNYYPFGLIQKGYNNVVSSNANSTAEKFKYNSKELEEELGKDTYAYGWRDYDPAIGRFNKVDRFAEKYYSLSTYSYAGNNPVLFVDVQGDSIAAGSQKQYDRIKNSVTKTRNNLQGKVDKRNAKAQKNGWSAEKTASKIGNLQERVASLDGTLSNFGTLESSTQVYELKSGQTEGGITYDSSSGNIVIGYGNTANFVHEATHAGQFESGGIAFSTTKGTSLLQDLGDETAAYKAQFAYSPSSVSGLSGTTKASSFAGITGAWVQGLNDAGGNKLYAPGGSANTGITPININSTRADLMRAYPGNTNVSGQPANLNLQTQPTIYFKRQ